MGNEVDEGQTICFANKIRAVFLEPADLRRYLAKVPEEDSDEETEEAVKVHVSLPPEGMCLKDLISLANATPTAYMLVAAPLEAQASHDTDCGTLNINSAGVKGQSGAGENCW